MPPPRVSVVIPTYNRQNLVVEAVESVLAQTFKDFEIIVVDDGSTDDTSSRMQPYLDRLTYNLQKNKGVAAARNTGIGLAQGEFVCFLDSDDLWEPFKLETQVRFADTHPEYALISTEIQGFDVDRKAVGQYKSAMYEIRNGFVLEQLLIGNWIQTSTVMLRRKCLDEVGGFDEDIGQYGEDWLLWMRVASRFPMYFLPEPLVSYRVHPGRLTHYQPEEQFKSLMLCLQKMSSFPQFQQKPALLREVEYRICVSRGRNDLHMCEYNRAAIKFKRAYAIRTIPVVPAYFMICAAIGKKFHKRTQMTPAM